MGEQLDLGIKGPRNIRIEMSDLWNEITVLSRKIMEGERAGRNMEKEKERLEALRAEHVALEQELTAPHQPAN